MKITASIFCLSFFGNFLFSQTFQRLDAPVFQNGHTLLSPWTGGLNAPQWSKVDLNGDGKMDLYEFDRDGFVHVPFLNMGEANEAKYVYAPELVDNFPLTWNFVLLRDYNKDGVMDFFGHSQNEGIPGFKVYNGMMQANELKFEREEFTHWTFDIVTVPLNAGGFANLEVSRVDYPAIDDLDGDGDLDILAINPNSAFQVAYYRNYALEQGFTVDTLIFRKEDECWGKFALPIETVQYILSGSPDTCAAAFAPHGTSDDRGGLHGAGSLCTYDEDNDGDKELLYGDLNYPQIMKAHNGGTKQKAFTTDQDVTFPNYNVPVRLPDFPASFCLDFDNDGLDDMLFAPNESNVSTDVEVWFYKNVTSNEFPVFNLSKKNAMVDEMIDVGSGSHPAFFDYNADGLLDIVIGNFYKKTTTNNENLIEASLYLYENVGTTEEPAFELIDDDWLGFKQFSSITRNYAPAFGDIDQDGDLDLFVGEQGGYLFFVENKGGAGNPATWGSIIPQWQNIRIGNYPTPYIFDLNNDGLEDLIAGEQGGNINYLPNVGTTGNPVFNNKLNEAPNNQFLGSISTIQNTNSGFSAPAIIEFMDTVYLITGAESGYLSLYMVDAEKLEFGDTFKLISNQFAGYRSGSHSRISLANINDDEVLDAVIDNRRGGVGLYATPFGMDGPLNETVSRTQIEFEIYPNPANNYLIINFNELYFGTTSFQIINAMGQVVQDGQLFIGENKLNVAELNSGFYFIKISQGQRIGMQKIIIKK
ncbi:MAG: T9SS type A sorting domain-containing protein [Saprospiraceae bacterium]